MDASAFDGFEEMIPEQSRPPAPRDELDEQIGRMLSMTMDQGSHSILDVARVGTEPGFGVVVPIPDTDLHRILGTTRPTRSQVEKAQEDLLQLRQRWEGSLVVT